MREGRGGSGLGGGGLQGASVRWVLQGSGWSRLALQSGFGVLHGVGCSRVFSPPPPPPASAPNPGSQHPCPGWSPFGGGGVRMQVLGCKAPGVTGVHGFASGERWPAVLPSLLPFLSLGVVVWELPVNFL